jgi:hypothetical protein
LRRLVKWKHRLLGHKFARLIYKNTYNLGDEIQTLAAQSFLPYVDLDIDRERLDECPTDTIYKLILNGWFMHEPWHWPPSGGLNPLITSFHITDSIFDQNSQKVLPRDILLSEKKIQYLKKHSPIGARDLHTRDLLLEHGINSYFSGCLTLTLDLVGRFSGRSRFLAVDVPESIVEALEARHAVQFLRLTQSIDEADHILKFKNAKELLRLYAESICVVTTKLHCALPCLAIGTPTLFVETQPDRYRFSGLREFFFHTDQEKIFSGAFGYDVINPPANPTKHYPYREALIRQCEEFTGVRKVAVNLDD